MKMYMKEFSGEIKNMINININKEEGKRQPDAKTLEKIGNEILTDKEKKSTNNREEMLKKIKDMEKDGSIVSRPCERGDSYSVRDYSPEKLGKCRTMEGTIDGEKIILVKIFRADIRDNEIKPDFMLLIDGQDYSDIAEEIWNRYESVAYNLEQDLEVRKERKAIKLEEMRKTLL